MVQLVYYTTLKKLSLYMSVDEAKRNHMRWLNFAHDFLEELEFSQTIITFSMALLIKDRKRLFVFDHK
jgi:hypothetical protein